MTITRTLVAAAALSAALGVMARADELQPATGQSIELGTLSGTAYYTVAADGFHVVATLADRRTGAPVRLEATLAAGQTVVLSTPGGRTGAPHTVQISRQNSQVVVRSVSLTN